MAVTDSCHYLCEDLSGSDLVELLLLLEKMEQLSALQVLHHDYHLHVGQGIAIKDFDDVRVAQGLEGFDLTKDHVYISGSGYLTTELLIFYNFRILIAARVSLMLLLASQTRPNPPSPKVFSSWYYPKLRVPSKSYPTSTHNYLCSRICDRCCGHTRALPRPVPPPRAKRAEST